MAKIALTWFESLGLNEAMTTTKSKAGHKLISYRRSSDNKTIDGLYKCPDGRWKVVATGLPKWCGGSDWWNSFSGTATS
jgi:hypothetical protein